MVIFHLPEGSHWFLSFHAHLCPVTAGLPRRGGAELGTKRTTPARADERLEAGTQKHFNTYRPYRVTGWWF